MAKVTVFWLDGEEMGFWIVGTGYCVTYYCGAGYYSTGYCRIGFCRTEYSLTCVLGLANMRFGNIRLYVLWDCDLLLGFVEQGFDLLLWD